MKVSVYLAWVNAETRIHLRVIRYYDKRSLAWVNEGVGDHFDVAVLEEPADLRQNGDGEDGDDDANEDRHSAELARRQRVTDVDVTLDGQRHRQPDGRRMERRRDVLGQTVVGETPRVRHPVTISAERVEVDKTRHRPDACSVQFTLPQ